MHQTSEALQYLESRLSGVIMFQNLTAAELAALASITGLERRKQGETIITQDSSSHSLYVILEGRVDILVSGQNKKEIFISHVKAGDVIGEASIFMDVTRTATARADTDVTLAALTRENFKSYLNTNPEAGVKILSFIIYSLLNKLALANKGLALEKESQVTADDIDELKKLFPKAINEIGK